MALSHTEQLAQSQAAIGELLALIDEKDTQISRLRAGFNFGDTLPLPAHDDRFYDSSHDEWFVYGLDGWRAETVRTVFDREGAHLVISAETINECQAP